MMHRVRPPGGVAAGGVLGGLISLILPFRLLWGIFWVIHHTTSRHSLFFNQHCDLGCPYDLASGDVEQHLEPGNAVVANLARHQRRPVESPSLI